MVTGGGTGGHVFPAIEVARTLQDLGESVSYLGSLRGQESGVCERFGIRFQGFASEPLYSLRTVRGLKAAIRLLRAQVAATRYLRPNPPRMVFSTGGYASAPVVAAARKLGIPYVLHEQNSVPGRTNRMLSRKAVAVATVFHATAEHFPVAKVIRTGMPVRREIRLAASDPVDPPLVLVMGGSQGATALNESAVKAAQGIGWQWLHVAGPAHFDSVRACAPSVDYRVEAFLQVGEMAKALAECSVAFCRSGAGTIAELAARRVPSVLVPYPHAFGDHQRFNAQEIAALGGATVLEQSALSDESVQGAIRFWFDGENRQSAVDALAEWDVPDATERLVALVRNSAG